MLQQGVLMFIAASDILPPLMRESRPKRAAIRAFVVVLSMAAIGLTTLIGETHCEGDEEGGGGDAH